MSVEKNIELRSEEVQEIMGTPPKWIVRRGIAIISIVIFVLLAGSWFYKYPDIIEARVVILSENPPVSVVARSDGKLSELFVIDKQHVDAGTILGIIENPADYREVYQLKNFTDSLRTNFDAGKFAMITFNNNLSLGQNQAQYSLFASLCAEYQTFLNFNPFDQRIQSLDKQVADYNIFHAKLREQISVLNQDFVLANSQFRRDSLLFSKKVMSAVDFEKSEAAMLKQKYAYQSAMTNLASTQITINQLIQQKEEQKVQKAEAESKIISSLKESAENLGNQLLAWEQAYVLKTPIPGIVTFTSFWSKNQFVTAGNIVFTIIPTGQQEIIGKANIPVAGAGKVEVGRKVNIKLDNFPYMEFGMLQGEVRNISMVPVSNGERSFYTAEISMKNSLFTNYNKELPFNQEMQGVAEIITKDRRLIERLIQPLISIFREKF